MAKKKFTNGFASWIEAYYEMVELITIDIEREDNTPFIAARLAAKGHGGLYELAEELTDEFEKLHQGREWDGEFYDIIAEFLGAKNQQHLNNNR